MQKKRQHSYYKAVLHDYTCTTKRVFSRMTRYQVQEKEKMLALECIARESHLVNTLHRAFSGLTMYWRDKYQLDQEMKARIRAF